MNDHTVMQQFNVLTDEIEKIKKQFKHVMIEQKDYYDLIQKLTLLRLHIDSFR